MLFAFCGNTFDSILRGIWVLWLENKVGNLIAYRQSSTMWYEPARGDREIDCRIFVLPWIISSCVIFGIRGVYCRSGGVMLKVQKVVLLCITSAFTGFIVCTVQHLCLWDYSSCSTSSQTKYLSLTSSGVTAALLMFSPRRASPPRL